jgi:hypothetical protein
MLRTMILAGLLSAAAGCLGTATVSGGGGGYYDAQPDLVEVEPGVQVIVDYDEPIFYSDNYYWRNDGGSWYRSSYYNRGWVSAQPPVVIGRISSRDQYRHYRPAGYQPGVRDHRDNRGYNNNNDNRGYNNNNGRGPEVRDHRNDGYNNPPPQGPVVRDHRGDNQPPPAYNPPPQGPVVREHGGGNSPPPPAYNPPAPQGPVVREHGGGNAPPPPPPPRREEPKGPVVREHR